MKTLEQINQELDESIPRSAVSSREGGNGKQLSYLAGHYVISRLNKVFGPLAWASDIKSLQLVHSGTTPDRYGKDVHTTHYIAQVRLVVQGPDGVATEHTDVGYGDGSDKSNPGKAHELAVKEAVTDALKRCAKNLGMSMGLALYDKDQPNVADDDAVSKVIQKDSVSELTQEKESELKAGSRPPAGDGNVSTRKSSPPTTRPAATGLHASRELLNKNISTIAKIALSKGRTTQQGLEDELKKYGAAKKEDLSDENAQKLFDSLKSLAG